MQAQLLTTLREYWSRDGSIAIVGGSARLIRAEQRATGAASRSTTASSRPSVRCGTSGSRRGCGSTTVVIGIHATAAAQQSTAEREAAAGVVHRMLNDGERVIDFYASTTPLVVPSTRPGWLASPPNTCCYRWLSQLDPPSSDELVSAWLATEEAFVAYGDVYEIARTRARCAEVLRAAGDAAGARSWPTWLASRRARSARSRCWQS